MKCDACGGTGKTVGIGCPGFVHIEMTCFTCGGRGEITAEMEQWKRQGEALRQARIDRRERQGDAAKRLGISTAQYSRIEFGLEPMPQQDTVS